MLRLVANNTLSIYDPLKPDAYVARLASVCGECVPVASEDILSAQGVLLVKKHSALNPELLSIIFPNKLKKPLELSFHFVRGLSVDTLEKDFLSLLEHDDVLLALNEHNDLTQLVKPHLAFYEHFPIVQQKLTVMAHAMPSFYWRTLHCVWLCLLITKEMHLSEEDAQVIFLSALAHDIGMTHVPEEIIERKTQLSPADWHQIQAHTYIGKKLLELMPSFPQPAIQAVYEHHERCDGTGYPAGKVESELGLAGQVIGLADSVVAIYNKRFKAQNRNWLNVIPIIQMNAQAYFFRHGEILMTLCRRSEIPFKHVIDGDELPEFIADLVQKNERLHHWFETLRGCLLTVGFTHGDRRLHSLQNVMLHVSTSIKGCGIFQQDRSEWLRSLDVKNATEFYSDIESEHVLQQEIVFHLQRLSRMTQLYVDSEECTKPKIQAALVSALKTAKQYML